jgi:hypothetical protein
LLHDLRWYLAPRLREEGWGTVGQIHRRLTDRKQDRVQFDQFPPGVIRGRYEASQFKPLVRGAAINIGFTQMDINPSSEYPRQIRLRDFEITAAGGFYLAQSCPELSLYYDVGREIAVWESAKDVTDRIRYYLAQPEERASIADAGHRRVLQNHTWLHRFASMAQELGMRLPVQVANEVSIA